MESKIGVIIVSYHNPKSTRNYIKEQLSKLSTSYTVVVVNVAATLDDSIELATQCELTFVDDPCKRLDDTNQGYLIWSQENLGYAKGNNLGVNFLERIGNFAYYLFSNDDIEIRQSNILDYLAHKLSENNEMGCIGPRILGLDKCDQSPHDRYVSPYRTIGWNLFPFLRKKKNINIPTTSLRLNAHYTYWVCGAFMMVKAEAFKKAGMFDNVTFLYFEEVILAERLASVGYKVYFDPAVEVLHYEGGSSGTFSKQKRRLLLNSQILYYRKYKHISKPILWLYQFSYFIHNILYKM